MSEFHKKVKSKIVDFVKFERAMIRSQHDSKLSRVVLSSV